MIMKRQKVIFEVLLRFYEVVLNFVTLPDQQRRLLNAYRSWRSLAIFNRIEIRDVNITLPPTTRPDWAITSHPSPTTPYDGIPYLMELIIHSMNGVIKKNQAEASYLWKSQEISERNSVKKKIEEKEWLIGYI